MFLQTIKSVQTDLRGLIKDSKPIPGNEDRTLSISPFSIYTWIFHFTLSNLRKVRELIYSVIRADRQYDSSLSRVEAQSSRRYIGAAKLAHAE